jgi:hypothetical protein
VPQAVAGQRAAGVERFFSAVFPLAPEEARELNRINASLARWIFFGSDHPQGIGIEYPS